MTAHRSWTSLRWWQGPSHVILTKLQHQETSPTKDKIYRALTLPVDEIRCCILGQDPYPDPRLATGLAFSVPANTRKLPPSLVNVFEELNNDLHIPRPSSGDLSPWERQGVFLWNAVPTCRPGSSRSHRGIGWEALTEEILDVLASRKPAPVFVLWGMDARTVFANRTATYIASPHPSPLSARRGFFGSRPFSTVNGLLRKSGQTAIDWRLP